MGTSSFFLFSVLFLCFSMTLSSSHPQNYTFELIHRDSPRSPFYNPLDTVTDRFNAAYNRSISRSHRFNHKTQSDLNPGLIVAGGQFLMSISIGTPPLNVFAIADTGSDLTWVQCEPCKHCFPQKGPLFDEKKSSTYKNVSCDSPHCLALYTHERGCEESNKVCEYSVRYGDPKSFSKGYVATETISILSASGSPVSFPGTVFGCSHNDGGSYDEKVSGIVGLGGGELSLISQLSSTISKKFSYCLSHKSLTTTAKSVINLGANSFPSGSNVISTPLADKETKTHYYLTLEAISVGKTKIPYTGKMNNNQNDDGTLVKKSGNIVIDSGSTFTLLDSDFFNRFITVVKNLVKGADRVKGPYETYCFKARNADFGLPEITMHFTGADVKLSQFNVFTEVIKGLFCLSMFPATGVAIPIYGFYAQLDFLVGYDLEKRRVSFQPKDCSKSL